MVHIALRHVLRTDTHGRFSGMAKRMFDLLVSLAALIVLFPIFVILALWIKADSAGPILFRQERMGLGGVPFQILKFRTMQVDAGKQGRLTVAHDKRVTRAG